MLTDTKLEDSDLANENIKTREHIDRVRHFMTRFAIALLKRAEVHDQSKLKEPEASAFAKANSNDFLAKSTYGSEEYKKNIKEVLGPALKHHYDNNSHHPEHYPNGVDGMDLLDLVEMFLDWRAATERHDNGCIHKSIEINKDRFEISEQLANIFENTAQTLEKGNW